MAGTEKQHVADDYAMRLSIGSDEAIKSMNDVIGALVSNGSSAPSFSFCEYLNESVCPSLNNLAKGTALIHFQLFKGQVISVIISNPLAWPRVEYVRLPVPSSSIAGTSQLIV